jgi:peroxiredoxin
MMELGQLAAEHGEFDKRKTRIVAVSLEDQEKAAKTQADFPHLLVVADSERKLAEAVHVIHRHSAPDGGDTAAPTTILVNGSGAVRWIFRADDFLTRLTPREVLAAVDEHMR